MLFFLSSVVLKGQEAKKNSGALLKADKLFIKMAYADAVEQYEKYLKKYPKDYYASRQAALCYMRLNDQSNAVEFWKDAVDNAAATSTDRFYYGKSLLSNNRMPEARAVFSTLKGDKDQYLAAWARDYESPDAFLTDSALTGIYEVKGLNTSKAEFSPVVYGNNLVYVTESSGGVLVKLLSAWANNTFYRFRQAQKSDSISFYTPEVFNKHIQSKYYNGPFAFDEGKNVLYFTRSASVKGQKKVAGNKENNLKQHIFITPMNRFGDAHPEITPFAYNSYDYNCLHPALSKDAQYLYFTSDMPGGFGGFDIYCCKKDSTGWGKPVNCGSEVNTPGNEVFPNLDEEGVLYFSSDYRPGMGGLDIFAAAPWPYKDKQFFEAENIGAKLNTADDDFGVYILDKSKSGYLSSNRKNKFRDDDIYYFINNKPKSMPVKIRFRDTLNGKPVSGTSFTISAKPLQLSAKTDTGYYFTRLKENREVIITSENDDYKTRTFVKTLGKPDSILIIALEPKAQNCIKGIIRDKDDNAPVNGLKVVVYDDDGNRYYDAVTDSSGRYQVCNLPFGKDLYIGTEKKPDYFTNTEKFKMPGEKQDVERDIYALRLVVGKAVKIDNIYFDLGKWSIRSDAAAELDKLVQLMKDNPEIVIELSSHTDCRGKASANLLLSDKRAKSSAAYLISKGIAKTRVKGKGYGESKLLNTCACEGKALPDTCPEEQHAQNRRSEFKVTGFLSTKQGTGEKNSKKSR